MISSTQKCAVAKNEEGQIACVWLEDNFDLQKMDRSWSVTFPTVGKALEELRAATSGGKGER